MSGKISKRGPLSKGRFAVGGLREHSRPRLKRISLGAFITDFVQRGSGRDELDGYGAVTNRFWVLDNLLSVHLREDLPAPAERLVQGDQADYDAALALHELILRSSVNTGGHLRPRRRRLGCFAL